jgi:DNA-binding GntR family transcriptional regulator
MLLKSVRPINLREQVVESIRMAIIEGRLKPNDHITEATLTEALGVSRTPIREALILLEREGLIIATPNKGCVVRAFTARDVGEIFSLRTALENFAGTLALTPMQPEDYAHLRASIESQRQALERRDMKAVRSIDMAFHEYIVTKSDHAMLMRNWREIVAQIAAILYIRADANRDYDESQSLRDHGAIVQALEDHDLPRLIDLNTQINRRVALECQRAIETTTP